MLLGLDLARGAGVGFVELGQAPVVVLVVGSRCRNLLTRFGIDRQKPRRQDDLPRRPQSGLARRIEQIDRRSFHPRRRHLAGDSALPHQRIQLVGVARRHLARPGVQVGRADRLMRFLGVLGLGGVMARRGGQHVGTGTIVLGDDIAHRTDRLAGNLDPVGPHIGDAAVLIQPLRHAHRVAGGEAQLARRLLLQRRGGERRIGVARRRLGFDRRNREAPGLDRRLGAHRIDLVAEVELGQFPAVEHRQPCRERRAARRGHRSLDRPVFSRPVRFDLAFAIDNDAQRYRLHAARTLGPRQLAPQHRRQGEADKIVERPPRPIGIDQIGIEIARSGHGCQNRGLGHLIEGHPLHAALGNGLPALQPFEQMPRNRLAFAVGIGGEDDAVGALGGVGNGLQLPRLVGRQLPRHGEIMLGIDRAIARRQIADVPETRQHFVVRPKIFVDRLGLGRRFHDHEIHALVLSVGRSCSGAAPTLYMGWGARGGGECAGQVRGWAGYAVTSRQSDDAPSDNQTVLIHGLRPSGDWISRSTTNFTPCEVSARCTTTSSVLASAASASAKACQFSRLYPNASKNAAFPPFWDDRR